MPDYACCPSDVINSALSYPPECYGLDNKCVIPLLVAQLVMSQGYLFTLTMTLQGVLLNKDFSLL